MPNPYLNPHFYGRDDDLAVSPDGNAELGQLLGDLEAARENGSAPLYLVQGSAGVGKTRLLQEFSARAQEHGCGAVYVSLFDCGREAPAGELVRILSKKLLHLDPQFHDEAAGALLRKPRISLGVMTRTMSGLGAAAAPILFPSSYLAGLAALGGASILKAIIECENNETYSYRTGALAADFAEAMHQLNTGLNRRKRKTALAIVVDQWDDYVRLGEEQRETLRETLTLLVRELNAISPGRRRVMFCLGVRRERAEYSLVSGRQFLESFNVKPLRHSVASDILLKPDGPEADPGLYFVPSAAENLANMFQTGTFNLAQGDLAGLLAVAANAVERAPSLPVSSASLPDLVEGGVAALVERERRRFSEHAKAALDEAQTFSRCLADEDDWTEITPLSVMHKTGIAHERVTEWLEWWSRETPLLAGSAGDGFHFRHETYQVALARSFDGEKANELRRARARLRLSLQDLDGNLTADGIGAMVANLKLIPEDVRALLGDQWREPVLLLSKALREKDSGTQIAAATALAQIGPYAAQAIPELVEVLVKPHPGAAGAAKRAIVAIGQPAVPFLLPLLSHSESGRTIMAISTIAAMGETTAETVDRLGDLVVAERGSVRGQAAAALGALGEIGMMRLAKLLAHENRHVRRVAAQRFATSRETPRALLPDLCAGLSDPDHHVRLWVVKAIGGFEQEARSGVGPLLDALRDPLDEVVLGAAEALCKIGPVEDIPSAPLLEALKHQNAGVRSAVARVLVSMEVDLAAAAPVVVAGLHDQSNPARATLASLLPSLGDELAVHIAAVAQLLQDSDPVIRNHTAEALLSLGDTAVDSFLDALKSSRLQERTLAIRCLGRIASDDDRCDRALIEALADGDSTIQRTAIQSLELRGTPDIALQPLVDALYRQNGGVAVAAASALGAAGKRGRHAKDRLLELRRTGAVQLRYAAIGALKKIG